MLIHLDQLNLQFGKISSIYFICTYFLDFLCFVSL